MKAAQPHRINTVTEYHALMELPKPEHPLVSVINFESIKKLPGGRPLSMVIPFYSIALKRNFNARLKYGQQDYDFSEGLMTFMAPGQVLSIDVQGGEKLKHSGWLLLVHPDFLWNTPLAKKIRQYEYFGYRVHEALHLSEKEEATVKAVLQNIVQEYGAHIDGFSHNVIIAQLELLLIYAERFYHRQFLTRRVSGHQLLTRLETLLDDRFNSDAVGKNGLPTVLQVANVLNVSPNYLSGLLKALTGRNTQQHIHDRLIEKAKEKLSATALSVSEIAYELGFEHAQSFSKFFKSKTASSPSGFRQSFN